MMYRFSKMKIGLPLCLILGVGGVSYGQWNPPSTAPIWTYTAANDVVPAYGANNNGKAAQFGMVDGNNLYVSSYNGHVYQLDLTTGALLADWAVCAYRAYSSPLKVNDQIYVFADRGLYRLDKTPTTQAVQLFTIPNPGTDRPEAMAYDPGTGLFLLSSSEKVYAVDATGANKWTLNHFNYGWGQALAADGSVYAYDTRYPTYDLSKRKLYKYTPGASSATKVWETADGLFSNVPFAYTSKGTDGEGDDLIFVVGWRGEPDSHSGRLTAIYDDGPNAGTTKWDIDLNHSIKSASLWEGHDMLIIPAMNGKVVWRRASTGEFIKEITLSAGITAGQMSPWSQITISGNYGLVLSHDGSTTNAPNYLFVIDLVTGAELWRSDATVGGAGCMLPILSEGIAVTGTYWQGTWYAYDLGEGNPFPFAGFANPWSTGNAPGALTQLGTGSVSVMGDLNNDGLVNNQDIGMFVLALTDPAAWQATYPTVNLLAVGDINGDLTFNNQDIAPFVTLLTGSGSSLGTSELDAFGLVPEPASLALLALGGAMLLTRRGRRGLSFGYNRDMGSQTT